MQTPIKPFTSKGELTDDSKVYFRHRSVLRKVLLIQPPAFSNNQRTDMNPNAPLGIAYIGAVLEQKGYEVRILDAFIEGWDSEVRISEERLLVGLPYDRIREIVEQENPDVVGITSMFTSQRKNAHKVAQAVKEVNRDIVVIVGGAHPTSATEAVLEDVNIDVVVIGEGDNTIVPLIECIENNGNLSSVDGIGYRDCSGRVVVQKKTIQIEDLDALPLPARHLLPMERYFTAGIRHGGHSRGQRAASVITARGCQYLCNFCTAFKVFTRRPRMRSIENVLSEIDQLVKNYGVDEIFFEDDQLIAKQRHAGDLFDAMAERYKNLVWDTPNGVSPWLLNNEIVGKMKAAGCYRINLAIESGVQIVLDKIINKPVKLDQIPGLVKLIRSHGMEVGIFVVIGNIGKDRVETIAQIKQSFAFCRKIRVMPHTSLLTAYPGSEVLAIAKERGFLVPNFEWDNLITQKFQLQTPEWTPAQLIQLAEWEQVKTHWWILMTSPMATLSMLFNQLSKDPLSTLKRIASFVGSSLHRAFHGLKSSQSNSLPHVRG